MPVILTPDAIRKWLDPRELPSDELMNLLAPYPAEEMEANPVSRMVNNARVDSPDCIESITDPPRSAPAKSPKRRRGNSDQPTLF